MAKPKLVEIRQGNLVFLRRNFFLRFNAQTGRLDNMGMLSRKDRFVLGVVTCVGVLVKNLDPKIPIKFAIAHTASAEKGRGMLGVSHQELAEFLRNPETIAMAQEVLDEDFSSVDPDIVRETLAALYDPLLDPAFLVDKVVENMGEKIKVDVSGAESEREDDVPAVVEEIKKAFENRGIDVYVDEDFLNIGDYSVLVNPFSQDFGEKGFNAFKALITEDRYDEMVGQYRHVIVRLVGH